MNYRIRTALLVSLVVLLGCSDDGKKASADGDNGSTGSSGGDNGSTSSSTSGQGQGGATMLPTVKGDPDPAAPDTVLPELPALVNVQAEATHDSVFISFEPIDGAVDYRVYELPDDDDITVEDDGSLTIQNAVYRCAGNRHAPPTNYDDVEVVAGAAVYTLVDDQDVHGYTRSLGEATLGYVYVTPGDDRVPVYALGSPARNAGNDCYFARWGSSRTKFYVTSEEEREALLDTGARDDGIVFYAPADDVDGTREVFTTETNDARFYYTDGPEAEVRGEGEAAFRVLEEEADGAVPLMRVFYLKICGFNHDELVPGMTRFERARFQGPDTPMYEMHWSGLTEETTLVVEALADGCPSRIPGLLGPESRDAYIADYDAWQVDYSAWLTVDEATAMSEVEDLYLNGQHGEDNRPRPIARSFVEIGPGPKPDLDWFMGFGPDETLGDFSDEPCEDPIGVCFQDFRQVSDEVDTSFISVESDRYAFGTMFGQLWITYADNASDTNGKFRFTPSTRGEMSADSFLYVTMDVDAFTTGRRYPQFLVSDQEPPVQHRLTEGNTVIVQTFGDWPPTYQVEVCDHRTWDVNNQCPHTDFHRYYDPDDSSNVIGLAPHPDLGDHSGVDRPTRFEAFLSTERVYVFLDGLPYGCIDLPDSGIPSGEVTVTFGDVLYHSGVDQLEHYDYYSGKLQHQARRHFDNLGFKSNVAAPEWNESRFPCMTEFFD